MVVKYCALGVLLVLAVISDVRTYKIKNAIVFPFLFLGIVYNTLVSGVNGMLTSFISATLPLFLLGVFYLLRMLGAGDIKLFSAIGAIMGLEFILYAMAFSFLAGGCMALALIFIRKNTKKRFLHLFRYLKNSLLSFTLLPYSDFEQKQDGGKFPFAAAVACGALLQVCNKAFQWL